MNEELNAAQKYKLDKQYNNSLKKFDLATYEAIAVSQSIGVQMAAPNVGHSTYVFARLCNHAVAMISAVPRSRWVRADFEQWDFGVAAGHSRAIFEGYLLFIYIIEAPECPEEWSARVNVMYLNDCTRRIKMLTNIGADEDVDGMKDHAEELRGRLNSNPWFQALTAPVKKRCLSGENLTIPTRDELLLRAGWEKEAFYAYWDLLSQYAHVLPVSFIRMVPGGRGTGLENDTDKGYLSTMLDLCADALVRATDLMEEALPIVATVRRGLNSEFSPGPRRNRRKTHMNGKSKAKK
ncbi:hypothetical protein ACDH60_27835 [Pseudomonas ficuserectae]|uniref:Uncharacterized protein n=1 Tax=Pseudomonas amygdali pv. lachrymans TaxID=53707 RepID=A0AB37R1S4_PSEAV|nr:hypothetical protein [Pseudomonas amygdali]KPC04038.1 Uncharacterized protein AC501_4957 [Pseudomonas amygdali pv. lachrymans]RMM51416.1 hypothetical protein ALQ79_200648 [Pseudomonas amygdali pv. lachrymans]RMP24759.1 hypothetical protein ALQ26_00576 [Pseudomonas amygdali pv. lachrymans]RMU16864.1 hypothetical protein ALP33_102469 [Pseudomonas amygdali pv. lachrymans]RMV61466.1 hypothetical protein ALP09_200150 [Pseudomonas amygdali pv. lachrymans]